jgi:hypothetical protein
MMIDDDDDDDDDDNHNDSYKDQYDSVKIKHGKILHVLCLLLVLSGCRDRFYDTIIRGQGFFNHAVA